MTIDELRRDVQGWAERFAQFRGEDDSLWYVYGEFDGKDAAALGDLFAALADRLAAPVVLGGTHNECPECGGEGHPAWFTGSERPTCGRCGGRGFISADPAPPVTEAMARLVEVAESGMAVAMIWRTGTEPHLRVAGGQPTARSYQPGDLPTVRAWIASDRRSRRIRVEP